MNEFIKYDNSTIYHGDCLEVMDMLIEQGVKVDMILTDPPYGTTACKWDSIIPFEPMWDRINKLTKDKGAIALFATQPFTSTLICSNLNMFKYLWTWNKHRVGGFTSAKLKPLKLFEDICIFSKGKTANCNKNNMKYYPQNLIKINKISNSSNDTSPTGYARPSTKGKYVQKYTNYPNQLLEFNLDKKRVHPTQKPVALLEYLIKTYTQENEMVLDFTMGSGSTCVACQNLNRRFIGIELDDKYFEIADKRIKGEI